MKKFLVLFSLVAMLLGQTAYADVPFRNHRYDSFKGIPVNNDNIVFYGNSITNMNEWWECFGSDHRIINRGTSGGFTLELLDNCEPIIAGQPAKLFVKIGTNDLGSAGLDSPELIASNIRRLVERFQLESPRTEIYIQSILPSTNGQRTLDKIRATNALIKQMCEEKNVTYVDLFDAMMDITTNKISYDGLHLTAKGYKIWCDIIAPYVGVDCSYPATFNENASSMSGSNGMRSTYWSVEEVTPDDILFLGDEMIHGGEWHELLKSPNAKDRGIGWGYGGLTLDQWYKNLDAILRTNPTRKAAPKTIALYIGVADCENTSQSVTAARTAYEKIIKRLNSLVPDTKLVLISLMPKNNGDNATKIKQFNTMISELADKYDNAVYADIYTPLAKNTDKYITQNYLYAAGYAKVAETLAPILGTDFITEDEFNALYENNTERMRAGQLYETTGEIKFGTAPGQYNPEKLSDLLECRENIIKLLATPGATTAQIKEAADKLEEAVSNLSEAIVFPDGTDDKVYVISDYRSGRYVSQSGNGLIALPAATTAASQWKFISREDGGYDIVNCNSEDKINTTAPYNTQVKLSDANVADGWKLKACDRPGYFIIVNGTFQLNTTNASLNYQVYNWGNGSNISDTGCQYLIAEAEAIDPVDPSIPVADESNPLFTLLDIPCTGTPYKVPDELAEKVLNHDGDMTVAVDLTINSNKGRSIIVSSCDSVNTSNPHFSTFVYSGGGIGVIYTGVDNGLEGWYTRGSGAGTGHHQLIYVASPTNGYTYYLDGSSLGNINGTKEYGLPNFGTQTGVNALYIGGTVHADTANKINLSDATIHSVRFYDRALTADEATSLVWDNLSGIEEVLAGIDRRPISTGIYDMTGRRYNDDQPLSSGFYIVNGTKTFVR